MPIRNRQHLIVLPDTGCRAGVIGFLLALLDIAVILIVAVVNRVRIHVSGLLAVSMAAVLFRGFTVTALCLDREFNFREFLDFHNQFSFRQS